MTVASGWDRPGRPAERSARPASGYHCCRGPQSRLTEVRAELATDMRDCYGGSGSGWHGRDGEVTDASRTTSSAGEFAVGKKLFEQEIVRNIQIRMMTSQKSILRNFIRPLCMYRCGINPTPTLLTRRPWGFRGSGRVSVWMLGAQILIGGLAVRSC